MLQLVIDLCTRWTRRESDASRFVDVQTLSRMGLECGVGNRRPLYLQKRQYSAGGHQFWTDPGAGTELGGILIPVLGA